MNDNTFAPCSCDCGCLQTVMNPTTHDQICGLCARGVHRKPTSLRD